MDEAVDGYKLVRINKAEISDNKKKAVGLQNFNGSLDGQMIESIEYELCKISEVDAVFGR